MTYFLGIDIAKRRHMAVVLNEEGIITDKPFAVENNRKGIDSLLERLKALGQPVEIGMEATGHYWLVLFDQLTQAGYPVRVLNPLQVHAFRRSGIRRRKTDKIDAVWIADYLRISRPQDALRHLDIHLQLRQLTRFRFSLTEQIGNAKRRIIAVLDRIFPEYTNLFSDIFITSSRQLLAEAVSPQDFVDFDLMELTHLLQKASHGRFGANQAQSIQQTARLSIGTTFLVDAARVEISCLLAQLDFLEAQVAQVDAALANLVAALPPQFLTTIPGVGPAVAASILAEVGDVARFPSLENLVAYAGIDPTVYESGQFQGSKAHMSKQGSPYLRHALWIAAHHARQHDPDLRAYYTKRRAEGKPFGVVMGALCRKLLARIYVVLREQRPYVIHSLPADHSASHS